MILYRINNIIGVSIGVASLAMLALSWNDVFLFTICKKCNAVYIVNTQNTLKNHIKTIPRFIPKNNSTMIT